jgi:hypothetical protein
MEENQALKNQDIARHFIKIKTGLQQSIKAYNSMLELVNNPLIEDSRIIEIAKEEQRQDLQEEKQEDKKDFGKKSEEEIFDQMEPDTENLEKLDGTKEV